MIQELLIVDVVDVDTAVRLPIVIADGVEFDRVSPSNLEGVKAWLDTHLTAYANGSRHRFESRWVPNSSGGYVGEEAQPRYFCFRSQHDSETIESLIDVVHLLPVELVPGCGFRWDPVGIGGTVTRRLFNPQRLLNSGGPFGLAFDRFDALPLSIPSIGQSEIDELVALLADRMRLEARHEPLKRAIRCFRESDLVHRASALWTLAHFTAIESALTHKPLPTDPVDSINQQIRRSVPLLLRRAHDAPKPESFGCNGDWIGVLKDLYDLRSKIAHGSLSRGDKIEKSKLPKDWDSIEKLLRELTKAVLRQCLREPDLAIDLKGPDRS